MSSYKTEDVIVTLEPELQNQAAELFAEMGLSLSAACAIFVRQSLLEGGMPFEYQISNLTHARRAIPSRQHEGAVREQEYAAAYC